MGSPRLPSWHFCCGQEAEAGRLGGLAFLLAEAGGGEAERGFANLEALPAYLRRELETGPE